MSNLNAPEISVVMSVYNGESKLATTIDSILAQEQSDFEVVIVNDGSTDHSRPILDEYATRDPRIKVFHQANRGLTYALRHGVMAAKGRYIARHDVGDRSLAGRFRAQSEYLRENPSVVAVGCGHRRIGPDGEVLGQTLGETPPQTVTERFLSGGSALLHAASMFRRDAYETAGGYRPEFRFAQDHDLWYRMSSIGLLGEVRDIFCDIEINVTGISAAHRQTQTELAGLARQAHEVRERGDDDKAVLEIAAQVSKTHAEREKEGRRFVAPCTSIRVFHRKSTFAAARPALPLLFPDCRDRSTAASKGSLKTRAVILLLSLVSRAG